MNNISVKFTAQELDILCSLAADQLFRREFIDKGFPGYQLNKADLGIGKNVVDRLRTCASELKGARPMARTAVAR
jgi:hypothetical protein